MCWAWQAVDAGRILQYASLSPPLILVLADIGPWRAQAASGMPRVRGGWRAKTGPPKMGRAVRTTGARAPGASRTTRRPDGCAGVTGVGGARGPATAAAIVPGVTQAVAMATAPVAPSAPWASCG